MKVKDLFTISGSWDIYENIADLIGVAFDSEGKDVLTEEGKKFFEVALEFPIASISEGIVVIDSDKFFKESKIDIDSFDFEDRDTIPKELLNVIDLFWFYAGYCSVEDYEKYFKENEEE